MTSVLLTSALLVGLLTLCVIASLALECWTDRRARRRSGVAPQVDPVPEQLVSVESEWEPAPIAPVAGEPPTVRPEEFVVIDGRDRVDQLIGVLFASYVAAGLPESKRVAAWVTADRQSDRDGSEFVPGADLRGRPAAVARLLALDQDGRCWVTLNDRVDISRGLSRRPPTCEVLAGLVLLWQATRSAMSLVEVDEVSKIVDSMSAVEPQWAPSHAADDVRSTFERLSMARLSSTPVRLQVKLATYGAVTEERVDGSSRSPHMTPPAPTQTV